MLKSIPITFIILALCSAAIGAETPPIPDSGRKQAKFVHRTYQMTLGAEARCVHKELSSSGEFKTELNRFLEKYPVLMDRLTRSPHYPDAVARFAPIAKFNPATDPIDKVNAECKYLASLLRSMVDTEDGQRSAKDVEVALAN